MDEKLYTIAISSLPEGWKAVAYRVPEEGEQIFINGNIQTAGRGWHKDDHRLIVEKIQPRRIVLEETGEYLEPGKYTRGIVVLHGCDTESINDMKLKLWREVKEGEL